jgi:Nuclear pore component
MQLIVLLDVFRPTYQLNPLPLVSENRVDVQPSPLRKIYHEPFDEHIRKILRKKATNPLLK